MVQLNCMCVVRTVEVINLKCRMGSRRMTIQGHIISRNLAKLKPLGQLEVLCFSVLLNMLQVARLKITNTIIIRVDGILLFMGPEEGAAQCDITDRFWGLFSWYNFKISM